MNEHTEQVVASYIQELLIEVPDETPTDQPVKSEGPGLEASPLEKVVSNKEGSASTPSTIASVEKRSAASAVEITASAGSSMHSAVQPLMTLACTVPEPSTRRHEPTQHAALPTLLLEGTRRAEVEKLLADSMPVSKSLLETSETTKPKLEPEARGLEEGPDTNRVVIQPTVERSIQVKSPVHCQDIDSEASRDTDDDDLHSGFHKAESPLLQWSDNGRPIWAQDRFDVLLFQVAGLTLAVPLIALGHIHPITDELTPIFGQADWFMGLQPSPNGRIRCVNTALFVMPDRYNPDFVQTAKYVVSIDGMDWGLAVDQVQQPNTIDPNEVTWRSKRTKRPWLAGTVKAAMCALIDVPQMGKLLCDSERKR